MYRNMAIIACSSIAVIFCWVIRWEHPLLPTSESKHRSLLSISTAGSAREDMNEITSGTFNPNASCTSVLTCVEPSLRDT